MQKMSRTTTLLSTKLSANLRISSSCFSFLTNNSLKDTRCLWKEVLLRTWTVYCRWEGPKEMTLQRLSSRLSPRICDITAWLSVSQLQRTTLVVGNHFLYLWHVRLVDVSGSSLTDEISPAVVTIQMACSRWLELKLSVPSWTNLSSNTLTIFNLFSSPLWFFKRCFWVFTLVFNFFEYIFRPFDFRWPFSLTTLLKIGWSSAGLLCFSKSCIKATLYVGT